MERRVPDIARGKVDLEEATRATYFASNGVFAVDDSQQSADKPSREIRDTVR